MAIRYSGDVEVRIRHLYGHAYEGHVRDPFGRWRGTVTSRYARPTSEVYDKIARELIRRAERALGRKLEAAHKRGQIEILRVFQAPCPV